MADKYIKPPEEYGLGAATKHASIPEADISFDTSATGHKHTGTDSAPIALDGLSDVNAPSPSDNDSLTWDDATSKWIPEAVAGGAHTLDSATHSDVTAITEAQGQVIYYDGSNWNALDPGNDGEFLKTQGAAANPAWAAAAGGGDVTGPASSTDNAIVRFHSTTGKVIQEYTSNPPTISDTGDVNIDGDLDVENIVVSGTVDGVDVAALDSAAIKDAEFTAADEVMVGTGAGTHGQVTLAASQFLAKKAAGAATNVTVAEALTMLSVTSGADVTADNAPQAHAASHKTGGADVLWTPRTYVWFVKGTVAVGTEQGATFRMKRATTVEDVELHVKTAPTGAALIVDINEAGTTLFTTEPEIDISGTVEDDNHAFSDTAIAAAAELTMDVVQVGSTVAGADLTVLLHCKEYPF